MSSDPSFSFSFVCFPSTPMKGKLSCPYRGSETPVQGRTPIPAGVNADPSRPFLFPSPFLLRGSRGKFSFPLPLSLTLQTATRRLLTTHPYSLDFPFVFSVVCVSPRSPDRGKSNICHQVKTKQKKTLWHHARRS